jgi:hypothetical protein
MIFAKSRSSGIESLRSCALFWTQDSGGTTSAKRFQIQIDEHKRIQLTIVRYDPNVLAKVELVFPPQAKTGLRCRLKGIWEVPAVRTHPDRYSLFGD